MLNLTTKKIIGILVSVAGVSAGGAGITYLISNNSQPKQTPVTTQQKNNMDQRQESKKTILSLLGEKGRKMLAIDGDESDWKIGWNKFKNKYSQQKNNNSSWAFNDWEKALEGEEAVKAFRDQCKTNSETDMVGDTSDLYEEVKDYCTKEKDGTE